MTVDHVTGAEQELLDPTVDARADDRLVQKHLRLRQRRLGAPRRRRLGRRPAAPRRTAAVLARLPDHPARRIDDLLPWNWTQPQRRQIAA